ncbi:hypothetical protein SAMN05660845_0484 [Flavobacterium swingsii]|uniref:Uncharacterized protein n=1 Tax=Flavobacterium swingsii TaxID=498292 RepID=A0A1I0VPP5_9FLAO|nr:hypothetical protein [Flavobacterium swingsii]SFA77636.1 hypothetical protein SAMN05660845_0484 [Flavobacterium swingsii]
MKKLFLILFITLTTSFYGQEPVMFKVEKSTIILNDNTEIQGEIDFPLVDDGKPLKYKNANGKQKIERDKISKVVFTTNQGGGAAIEYINMKVFNEMNVKVMKEPKLLLNVVKGKVSVYISSYTNNQFSYNGSASAARNTGVGFVNYYCIREGEEAASLIHVDSNYANENMFFRQNGRKYFADNTEIAAKIDKREYTYKNFMEVIELYNSKK